MLLYKFSDQLFLYLFSEYLGSSILKNKVNGKIEHAYINVDELLRPIIYYLQTIIPTATRYMFNVYCMSKHCPCTFRALSL